MAESKDIEINQFPIVDTLSNKDYIVVSLDNGSQGRIKTSDLASVVAALEGYVRKEVTLLSGESINISFSDVAVIMIIGTGQTMTGAAVFGLGYGVPEGAIKVISNTTGVVSIGTGSGLVVTKQQWGGSLITNKNTKTHDFILITIR